MPYKDKKKQSEYQVEWQRKRRLAWIEENGPCKWVLLNGKLCNSKKDLEVDHIDPSKKVTHRIWFWSQKRREKELKKCQVLCHRHHLIKSKIDLSIIISKRHKEGRYENITLGSNKTQTQAKETNKQKDSSNSHKRQPISAYS